MQISAYIHSATPLDMEEYKRIAFSPSNQLDIGQKKPNSIGTHAKVDAEFEYKIVLKSSVLTSACVPIDFVVFWPISDRLLGAKSIFPYFSISRGVAFLTVILTVKLARLIRPGIFGTFAPKIFPFFLNSCREGLAQNGLKIVSCKNLQFKTHHQHTILTFFET